MKKKSIMKSRIWSLGISIITSKSEKLMLRYNLLSLIILRNLVWHVAKSPFSRSCIPSRISNRTFSFPTPSCWSFKLIALIHLRNLNTFMKKMFQWASTKMTKWAIAIIKLNLRIVLIKNSISIKMNKTMTLHFFRMEIHWKSGTYVVTMNLILYWDN